MAIAKFITHMLEGVEVEQVWKNGYLNATKLSKAYLAKTGKQREVKQWLLNKDTKALIEHLSQTTGVPLSDLVITRKGGVNENRGTHLHPDLAPHFIKWLELGGQNQESDYLYLIQAEGTSIFKIGISSDVDGRVAQLQTGSPLKLIISRVAKHPNAAAIERQLHEKFAAFRSHGEWFSVPRDEATKAFDALTGAYDLRYLVTMLTTVANAAPIVSESGMINATHIEGLHRQKGGDRTIDQWLEDEATQLAIDGILSRYQLPYESVIQVVNDVPELLRGTYIHPRLSVRFVAWIDNDFGLALEDFILDRSKALRAVMLPSESSDS